MVCFTARTKEQENPHHTTGIVGKPKGIKKTSLSKKKITFAKDSTKKGTATVVQSDLGTVVHSSRGPVPSHKASVVDSKHPYGVL
jgi:hypothetical protein